MEITTPANVCHQCYFLAIDGAKHLNRTLLSNSSGVVEDSQDYPPTGLDSDEYDEYDEYGDYAEYSTPEVDGNGPTSPKPFHVQEPNGNDLIRRQGIDGAKHLNRTLLSNSSGVVDDSQDYPPTGLDSDEYDEYDEYGDYAEYRFVQI
ncbi:hypothetical protein CHS0354_020701 [Potamilus streckersoni]|uniref:Uncharacterized protein n=1 Tax=Potamilus streckersoni TaxID=2493646 RepID=A0AAE0TER9_9BIVA|nr:hypothetical protein CHS0354_020701 [Potamilus streckersoni]